MDRSQLADIILTPFNGNENDSIDDLKEMQAELKEEFQEEGIPIKERRMNPITTTIDIFNSLESNIKSIVASDGKNLSYYKLAAIDLLMLGLQAMPAYVKTDFESAPNGGKKLEDVTFNYTGVVIPWYTLPIETPFFGVPALAVNLINIVAGLAKEGKFKAHEWNHLEDKYIVQELYDAGLFTDMEEACKAIWKEPPYRVRTYAEMKDRAEEIMGILFQKYSISDDDPRLKSIIPHVYTPAAESG